MTDQERITALEARIAALEARLATIEMSRMTIGPMTVIGPGLYPWPSWKVTYGDALTQNKAVQG